MDTWGRGMMPRPFFTACKLSLIHILGLSLPLVLMQYLAGYYTGPVIQGLIPCLLGCGAGLVISYPLARKIGEASFQRLLAVVIGLSGFSILTRALLDS